MNSQTNIKKHHYKLILRIFIKKKNYIVIEDKGLVLINCRGSINETVRFDISAVVALVFLYHCGITV